MNDLISRKALIAEYDRVHIGPPGGARKLMEDAPSVNIADVPHWATEEAYKNGYEHGKKDAADNNVGSKWISVKDRLPSDRGDVLVCAWWHEKWQTKIGWYNDVAETFHILTTEEGDLPWWYVTHWMPLPEAPKEAKEDGR